MNNDKQTLLHCQQVSKTFSDADQQVQVLNGVNFTLHEGDMLAIVGASGSGKSTLLHILGSLDDASAGEVLLRGQPLSQLKGRQRARWRNQNLGFIYQFHHLLPEFTALDNVAMPLIVRRLSRSAARAQAAKIIEQVGLAARAHHYPGQLYGGERQRIALARALVTQPACVLADEPTGNLDQKTAQEMFALLQKMNQELGIAFIIVTHDPALAALAHRQLSMEQGILNAC